MGTSAPHADERGKERPNKCHIESTAVHAAPKERLSKIPGWVGGTPEALEPRLPSPRERKVPYRKWIFPLGSFHSGHFRSDSSFLGTSAPHADERGKERPNKCHIESTAVHAAPKERLSKIPHPAPRNCQKEKLELKTLPAPRRRRNQQTMKMGPTARWSARKCWNAAAFCKERAPIAPAMSR